MVEHKSSLSKRCEERITKLMNIITYDVDLDLRITPYQNNDDTSRVPTIFQLKDIKHTFF